MLVLVNAVKVNSARCDRAIVINQSALYSSDARSQKCSMRQLMQTLSGEIKLCIMCRIRLDCTEARLSLTDKNIGTSARFYA